MSLFCTYSEKSYTLMRRKPEAVSHLLSLEKAEAFMRSAAIVGRRSMEQGFEQWKESL